MTVSDVYSARVLDAKEAGDVSQALQDIAGELAGFKLIPHWNVFLNNRKARLEALEYRAAGMDRGGDELKLMTQALRKHAIGFATDILKRSDRRQVSEIEAAEAVRAQFMAQNSCDWSWQVYRGDVIPDDEASAALLCESATSIAQIVKGAEQFEAVHPFLACARAEVLDIVRGVRAGGHNIDDLEQKLTILGVAGAR